MAEPISQGGIDYYDGGFISGGTTFPVIGDLAELAARLGSVDTWNREGLVIHLEDFGAGVAAWTITGSGTGAEAITSNAAYRSAPYSCKMVPGSTSGFSITLQRYFPLPELGTYGLEMSFCMTGTADRVQLFLVHRDGSEAHWYGLEYDHTEGELLLYDATVVWLTLVTGLDLNDPTLEFVTLKMAVDLESEKHMRAIVNGVEYDTSLYGPLDASDSDGPSLEVRITVLDESGGAGHIFVDDIIQTLVEPTR